MTLVLSADELRNAVVQYLAKQHPDLAGRPAVVTFERRPLTNSEHAALNAGLRVEAHDLVQARIEVGA